MLKKRKIYIYFIIFIISLIFIHTVQSQTWVSIPPYNTLWPLWSPILSPPDPITQVSTPIVTSLSRSTILPVQPSITWDPQMPYPWFLYNTPFGLGYYDIVYESISLWPPCYLINPLTFAAVPITLPSGYSNLPPISTTFLSEYVVTANEEYNDQFGPNAFLLTALQLLAPYW